MSPLEEAHSLVLLPRLEAVLGFAHARAGHLEQAERFEVMALREADRLELPAMRPICLRWHAETAHLTDAIDKAAPLTRRLIDECNSSGQRGHAAWALFLRGRIALKKGEVESAEADFTEAADEAERLGLAPLVAHCNCRLGSLLIRTSRAGQARRALVVASRLYRSMGMAA
jgi:hypothetical protein